MSASSPSTFLLSGYRTGADTLPGANLYENAAGDSGIDTKEIVTDYVEHSLGLSMKYTPISSAKSPVDTAGGVNPTLDPYRADGRVAGYT